MSVGGYRVKFFQSRLMKLGPALNELLGGQSGFRETPPRSKQVPSWRKRNSDIPPFGFRRFRLGHFAARRMSRRFPNRPKRKGTNGILRTGYGRPSVGYRLRRGRFSGIRGRFRRLTRSRCEKSVIHVSARGLSADLSARPMRCVNAFLIFDTSARKREIGGVDESHR